MRELKFRAWSIKKRKWLDIDTLYCANGKICGVVCGGVVYDAEDVVLEQYTGLKDKNGKEIYEGDIVDKKYDNLAIFDRNGVVGMGYLYDSDGYNNGEIYGWKAGDSSLADVCDACEIIGNIHENPELISKRKLAEYLRSVK